MFNNLHFVWRQIVFTFSRFNHTHSIHAYECDIDDDNNVIFWIQVKTLIRISKEKRRIQKRRKVSPLSSLLYMYIDIFLSTLFCCCCCCCLDSFLMTEPSRFSLTWRKMFYSIFASHSKMARFPWWRRKIILSLYFRGVCVSLYISCEPHEAPQVRFANAQQDQTNRCMVYMYLLFVYINFLPINVHNSAK